MTPTTPSWSRGRATRPSPVSSRWPKRWSASRGDRRPRLHRAAAPRPGRHALPAPDRGGRVDGRGGRPQLPPGRARGAHAPHPRGVPRHRALVAPRPPPPAAPHPRRPRGIGQRPVRRARPAEERQHRRRRRAADVPGHGHGDRDGQAGRARAHRRRRRAGHQPRHPADLRDVEPALLADGPAHHVGREEHRHEPARPDRALRDGGRRLQAAVHGQGRRLGQQELPVPGDQSRPEPVLDAASSSTRSCARSEPPPARRITWPSSSAARPPNSRSRPAKYASAHYLDTLPTTGSELGHGFRDLELEQDILALTQGFGIGAQFGGKYFCHDVRVVRLPRHGASCPVAVAVSCSADRQALGKITRDGVFLEQLEEDPASYLPEVTEADLHADDDVVRIDLNRPMAEIRAELSPLPGEDAAVAERPDGRRPRHRPRQDQGAPRRGRADARLPARPLRLLRGPGQDAEGLRVRLLRADHGRAHGLLRRPSSKPRAGRS